MWFLTILMILFIDRENTIMVIVTIFFLLLMTSITILRSIDSRNQWRQIIEDGDVEIKDKIKF